VVKSLDILEKELSSYLTEIKNKHSENAKAVAFTSFIEKVFDIESRDLDFEVPIKTTVMELKGRIDAVFGNLIIEFKKDLRSNLETAKDELLKYFQAYHEKFPDTNYLGIANDGILFKVFHPIYENNKVSKVEEIDQIDLERRTHEEIFLWFDSYLFASEKIIPSSLDIKRRFGLESPTFASVLRKLEILFEKAQIYKPAVLKYDSWNRYLEIVYGDKPNEKRLFFKHTYLSTLVKLIVHIKLSGGKVSSIDEIFPILYGSVFMRAGIKNFIEEDFFTWTSAPPIRKQSSRIFHELLRQLYIYDLEKIDEDVLKELYQELVDPEVRKLLGEFYTPDWLAEGMISDLLKEDPSKSVMDPSCGSGTFLFKTIQFKIKELLQKGWSKEKILEHVTENVIGFDIHPLAVIIAKTNYLLALRDIIHHRKGSITIPVYLSDSLKIPTKKTDISFALEMFEFEALDKIFRFPTSIASNLMKMDDVVDNLREYGQEFEIKLENEKSSLYGFKPETYTSNMLKNYEKSLDKKFHDNEIKVLVENLKTLYDLILTQSDAIWPYILRNMYKPIAILHRKVDLLIGNPPWLGLNNMKDEKYQDYLKERSKHYELVDKKKIQNVSNLNLATLFFCQCTDQYLGENGRIAFVMPQSVLVASQHVNFVYFKKFPLQIEKVYDLEKVSPLFRIPSCVVFGTKHGKTEYPIEMLNISGKLDSGNASLEKAEKLLLITKTQYTPTERTEEPSSYYYSKFSQGAQIIPRCFWFVDIQSDSFLGFNPMNPFVKTSDNRDAKAPWDSIIMEGNIEKQFIFTTLLSKDIVPFTYLKRRIVALPILVNNNKIELIVDSKQNEIVRTDFSKYLMTAEVLWDKHAPAKSKKSMSIYDRVDYQKDLSSQNPYIGYSVLYVKSATYLASCVVSNDEEYNVDINGNTFPVRGFFAEGTTYFYNTESEEEAHYLCGVFNSKTLDDKIKPFQSKGSFGERDIHKLPLTFPIPEYNPKNKQHKELSELAKICQNKTMEILPKIELKSIGKIRSTIRESLETELSKIDALVASILGND
jgi:hypothetical protein